MSTQLNQDVSADVLDLARSIQQMIDHAVRRREAEREQAAERPRPDKVGRDEAAAILGVKPRTVYAYVEQGVLEPVRTGPKGGRLMFRRADVEKLAKGEKP